MTARPLRVGRVVFFVDARKFSVTRNCERGFDRADMGRSSAAPLHLHGDLFGGVGGG